MEAIKEEIYNHDSDVDVTHKINTIELDNWINHLNYIKKELDNLIGLCGNELNNKVEMNTVLEQFKKKQTETDTMLRALQRYVNSRSQINECEDIQCDMTFINEHESYRRSYLYHLDKYRRLKDEFFEKIQGTFTLLRTN